MAGPKFLSVKNFEQYQHYKQRNPPWIKLYKTILGDRDFLKLTVEGRYLYLGLLILASECDNKVVNDPSFIAHRLAISPSQINLTPLFKSGFLLASEASIRRYRQKSREETETETETEERQSALASAPPTLTVLPKPARTRKPMTEWPDGFQYTEKHKAIADGLGLNVAREFADFHDRAIAKNYTYADWDAAFRVWLRKADEFKHARAK